MLTFVTDLITLQRDSIITWKQNGIDLCQSGPLRLVEENHAFNYQLWHAEDRARREDMGHTFVYHAKREIDQHNQQRNNRMEAIDEWLFTALKPAAPSVCPVHSETPGMMIDRLSILALKLFHMIQQSTRQDVNETHRQACLDKSRILREQQKQLHQCLSDLLDATRNQTRTFRVYHQFKMYNDPALNPELY
ncbi:MAG: DUF4254 domain-containing protein [Legionellaceae bacterium]|nr:DUF4254 domain-containing protein [Legionellaceae bacterium]